MSNALVAQSKKAGRITVQSLHEELQRLRERIEDLEDLRDLNEAIARNQDKKLIPWEQTKKDLGLDH